MKTEKELEELDITINNLYRLIVVQAEALSVLGTEFNHQCDRYAQRRTLVHEKKKAFTHLKKLIGDMRKQLDTITENSFKFCDPELLVQTADNLLENGRELARLSVKWAGVSEFETIQKIEELMDENNKEFVPKNITDKWKLQA